MKIKLNVDITELSKKLANLTEQMEKLQKKIDTGQISIEASKEKIHDLGTKTIQAVKDFNVEGIIVDIEEDKNAGS